MSTYAQAMEKARIRARRYRENNPRRKRSANARYYENNHEKCCDANRRHRAENYVHYRIQWWQRRNDLPVNTLEELRALGIPLQPMFRVAPWRELPL